MNDDILKDIVIPSNKAKNDTVDESLELKLRLDSISENIKGNEQNLTSIEDELFKPIDIDLLNKKRSESQKEENTKFGDEKRRLQEMFKNVDISKSYYETDKDGNLIVGYEDVLDKATGKIVKTPIVQKKVYDYDMDLRIEVKLDPSLIGKKDKLGLNPEERKRYDKLVALNKSNGNYRNDEELIKKAKNVNDLDSSIIPDVMMNFIVEKEEGLDDLSDKDKENIKRLRKKGLAMDPEVISGIKKSLKLATADKSIHIRNTLTYLTHRNVDISQLTEESLELYAQMYKDDNRPSLSMVLEILIDSVNEIMYSKIKNNYPNEKDYEAEVIILKANPQARDALLQYFKDNNDSFFKPEDFIKLTTFFNRYGLSDKDLPFFDRNLAIDPKDNNTRTMGDLFDEFKAKTDLNFFDVYEYHHNLYKKQTEQITVNDDGGYVTDTNHTNDIKIEKSILQLSDLDDMEFD